MKQLECPDVTRVEFGSSLRVGSWAQRCEKPSVISQRRYWQASFHLLPLLFPSHQPACFLWLPAVCGHRRGTSHSHSLAEPHQASGQLSSTKVPWLCTAIYNPAHLLGIYRPWQIWGFLKTSVEGHVRRPQKLTHVLRHQLAGPCVSLSKAHNASWKIQFIKLNQIESLTVLIYFNGREEHVR